jgi:hypothetical protein
MPIFKGRLIAGSTSSEESEQDEKTEVVSLPELDPALEDAAPLETSQTEERTVALARPQVNSVSGRWFDCRRRAVRVDIRGGSCPVYISYPEVSDRKFPVTTIAELGAKYVTEGANVSPLLGHEILACLHFGPIRTTIQTRMVSVEGDAAAVEFSAPTDAFRALIRDAFELELTAASMVPFHNFTSPLPGPSQTTVYSDGESHVLELFVRNNRLVGLCGKLSSLELKLVWSESKRLKIVDIGEERTQGPHFKKRLMSFVRNLQGLQPQIRETLESVISSC